MVGPWGHASQSVPEADCRAGHNYRALNLQDCLRFACAYLAHAHVDTLYRSSAVLH